MKELLGERRAAESDPVVRANAEERSEERGRKDVYQPEHDIYWGTEENWVGQGAEPRRRAGGEDDHADHAADSRPFE